MFRRAAGLVLAIGLVSAAPAHADDNDLVLSRLATRIENGQGVLTNVIGQNLEFRALASQLGVVLAPHLLTPADTIGFGGFQLSVDYTTTTIDANAPYWRARQGDSTSDMLSTIGLFARKGMWFPVPSFEVGVGAVHLVDSKIWTGQLYAKLGLHEGYRSLPIPSVAVRGAVSRMMSQRELDLTVASLDVTISKHFGIGGTWRFDPYAGWNLLMIIPRSEVIHDLRWSAIQMAQIEGRCHRDGRFAQVYWAYADGTIEDRIARVVAGRIQSMKEMVGDDVTTLREIERLLDDARLDAAEHG